MWPIRASRNRLRGSSERKPIREAFFCAKRHGQCSGSVSPRFVGGGPPPPPARSRHARGRAPTPEENLMKAAKSLTVVVMLSLVIFAGVSHAQERLKKIRITYPTESIAVLPLFAAYRWKTFEDNDLQAEIIQAALRWPTRRWRAVRSAILPALARRR